MEVPEWWIALGNLLNDWWEYVAGGDSVETGTDA